MSFKIKNWSKFQHFKDRRPPWIKLYRDLLDDIDWHELDPLAAKCLVMIWLIASEDDGRLPDLKKLAFRLRLPENQIKSIVSKLSHWLEQDDITMISERYQDDLPETERETEKEREKETDISPKQVRTSYSKEFELFWDGYPRDSNMSKKEAFSAWKRISDEDRKKATEAVPHFSAYCKANPDYRPIHAVRFLTKARWEGFLQASEKPRGGNRWGKAPHEMNPQELEEFLAEQRAKQHEARTNLQ
jgi:hypothetical protein